MRCRYCRAETGGPPHCRRCAALHEEAWDLVLDRVFVKYRETNLEVLKQKHPNLVQRYSDILSYNHHSDHGMVIHGPPGTGKTRCCWLLMRRLHDDGVTVGAISAPALGDGLSNAAWEGDMTQWIGQLVACDVLFVDDIDKIPATPRVQQGLYTVIEQLTSTGRKLVVTANATGDAFLQPFSPTIGPAILRRIREFCRGIYMPLPKPQ